MGIEQLRRANFKLPEGFVWKFSKSRAKELRKLQVDLEKIEKKIRKAKRLKAEGG